MWRLSASNWGAFAMLIILACGAGIYIGRHFGVLALLPFSLLGAGAFVTSRWMSGQGFFASAGMSIVLLIALQIGYFVGVTSRGAYTQLLARLNISQSNRV
jgi:nitric oxide reductase large subunit